MNIERITALADAIEKADPESFDMATFSFLGAPVNCNSAGCIAGWTVTVFDPDFDWVDRSHLVEARARELLDLKPEMAHHLFYADGGEYCINDLHDVRPEHAVKMLRDLAQKGDFDWRDVDLRHRRTIPYAED